MEQVNALKDAINSVSESLNSVFAKLPPEMSAQIPKVQIDVNKILKSVQNNDMEALTKITKKYANKNNK